MKLFIHMGIRYIILNAEALEKPKISLERYVDLALASISLNMVNPASVSFWLALIAR